MFFEMGNHWTMWPSVLWSDFVRSLVPPGVAQLFFFDGEKIRELAEKETEALALGDSIKALLGLDLVERLQADLDIFSARQARRTAQKHTALRLRELDKEIGGFQREIEKIEEGESVVREKHAELAAMILQVEEQLVQSGEGLTSRLADLRQDEAKLVAELGATEEERP